jgi:hypothetical protein
MYLNTTVKIPEIKGKIIAKKKGTTTYILYQYGSEYHPEKQYSVPLRTIVGKMSSSDSTLMFPNERFQSYFPEVELPEELPLAYRSCCLKIGSCVIIQKILNEYKLIPMLQKRFGSDTGLILDLVSYLIIEEENAGQYYPDFAFTHPLMTDKMTIYSDSKVCRLLNAISKDQCIGFLDDWNAGRDHKSRVYVSYDSTNKNSEAGDIDIVEFGKAKDDKGFPVFNLSIAMDKTNRIPLFYEEYPGSVTDVSQFTFMVDKVLEYGYKQIGFILDRGYFSKENIRYIDENGYSFIIMCRDWYLLLCLKTEEHLKRSGNPQFVRTKCMVSQRQPGFMKTILRKDISTFITIHRSRPLSGNIWNNGLRSCGSSWTDTSEKMKSLVKPIRSTFICIIANREIFWVLMNEPM